MASFLSRLRLEGRRLIEVLSRPFLFWNSRRIVPVSFHLTAYILSLLTLKPSLAPHRVYVCYSVGWSRTHRGSFIYMAAPYLKNKPSHLSVNELLTCCSPLCNAELFSHLCQIIYFSRLFYLYCIFLVHMCNTVFSGGLIHSSKGVLPCVLIRFRNLRCEGTKVPTSTVEPLLIMMKA
jgi:hypothetical protein